MSVVVTILCGMVALWTVSCWYFYNLGWHRGGAVAYHEVAQQLREDRNEIG